MTDALKPCPFCGGTPGFTQMGNDHGDDNAYSFVICTGCGATCANIDTRPEADCVDAWNRRAAPAVPAGWQMVPVEATEAQMLAGEEAFCATARPGATWAEHTGSVYRAMLAAAPTAQQEPKQ